MLLTACWPGSLVASIEGGHVRLGIKANTWFRMLRDELCEEPAPIHHERVRRPSAAIVEHMRSSAITLGAGLLVVSAAAQAKLPPAATAAIGHITQSMFVFFGVALPFALVGALAARKFAPRSRDARQAIFSITSFLGLAIAGFVTIRFLA